MGDYTRLTFWADLAGDSPAAPVLKYAFTREALPSMRLPEHAFFKVRWLQVLTGDSYYHRTGGSTFRWDDIASRWWLNVDASVKNYSYDIQAFLDWISPYDCGDGGFRGFIVKETDIDPDPELIYRQNDQYEVVPSSSVATLIYRKG